MPDYFCRVSCANAVISPLWDKLEIFNLIAYEHKENDLNIHVHFLVKNFTLSTDSLKGWIRKATGLKFKATDWSFKTKYKPHKEASEITVNDGCITYMSKGHLSPVFNRGFQDSVIEDYKLKWLDFKRSAKQSALTQYLVKETQAQSKLRQNEMVDEITKRFREAPDGTIPTLLTIIRQVVVIENHTILGRYKTRDYVDTVMSRAQPHRWAQSMLAIVTDKGFYQ